MPTCSITVGNSIVAMVIDLWCDLTYISKRAYIQFMPCSSRNISEKLPENHRMEKYDFLKPMTILKSFNSVLVVHDVEGQKLSFQDDSIAAFNLETAIPTIRKISGS